MSILEYIPLFRLTFHTCHGSRCLYLDFYWATTSICIGHISTHHTVLRCFIKFCMWWRTVFFLFFILFCLGMLLIMYHLIDSQQCWSNITKVLLFHVPGKYFYVCTCRNVTGRIILVTQLVLCVRMNRPRLWHWLMLWDYQAWLTMSVFWVFHLAQQNVIRPFQNICQSNLQYSIGCVHAVRFVMYQERYLWLYCLEG